jgi:hypothetical protein
MISHHVAIIISTATIANSVLVFSSTSDVSIYTNNDNFVDFWTKEIFLFP